MDRDEQVGALLAGDFGSPAQWNEVVAGTGQLGAEAFHAVDLTLQLASDLQYHVFLTLAARAGRARVFATVAGVDHHDNVAFAGRGWRQLDRRFGRGHRHCRHGCHRWRRGRRRRGIGRVVEQIDHQTVAVLRVRRQREAFRGDGFFQVDDHAQVGRRALGRAHRGDRRVRRLHVQRRAEGGAIDVDHQPVRGCQGENAVLHRAAEVKDQSRVVRRPPQAHAVDL